MLKLMTFMSCVMPKIIIRAASLKRGAHCGIHAASIAGEVASNARRKSRLKVGFTFRESRGRVLRRGCFTFEKSLHQRE